MRFILQKSEKPNFWVCTDTENLIVCIFKEHEFNNVQDFKMLDDFNPKQLKNVPKFCREMGDWLRENHYNKIFKKS